jgi:predicted nucleotidyltransferase
MTDFAALIRLLAQHNVEFILIGGAAATAHGSARLTQDLDIVYRRTPENIARLAECLGTYHPYLRGAPPALPFRLDAATIQRGLNFTLTTDLGALDLFGEIVGGGAYEALQADAIDLKLFGVACRCLSLRRLIEVKRAAGRPRDLNAVAELEALLDENEGSAEKTEE